MTQKEMRDSVAHKTLVELRALCSSFVESAAKYGVHGEDDRLAQVVIEVIDAQETITANNSHRPALLLKRH